MALRLALAAHLACAFGAAVLFWVPIAAAKGGPLHLKAGRLYVRLIYLTALTGAPLAAWLFARAAEPAAGRTACFLTYLIAILVMPVYHGVRVARAARTGLPVTSPVHTILSLAAIAAGVALCALAIGWREWPYVLLSPVGPVMGVRALVYARRGGPWREEHIVAMLMSGIAVYTALLVFGLGRTLGVQLTGAGVYGPWLLPAVVGLPLVLWCIRRERAMSATTPSTFRMFRRP
ncbi:MAG TPA: hypothetical protein VMN81_01045 [Vicinamibacterales bacterium]|nr:hypothetical protein [Vicinamibacterales bacterium]